jgi:hypothetical protein
MHVPSVGLRVKSDKIKILETITLVQYPLDHTGRQRLHKQKPKPERQTDRQTDKLIILSGMTPRRLNNVNVKEANIWSGVPDGARNQDQPLTDRFGQL